MENTETKRTRYQARILIVEDEAIEALDLQTRLTNLGYPLPDIVHNGADAVRKARDTRPDLVLMDIMLPGGIDGIMAAEQIGVFLDAPIIFLSAYSDEHTVQRAKITEPYAYVVKPFQERELQIAIEMALYRHATEKKLEELRKEAADVFNFAPVGYFILDGRGVISNANFTASHMLGLPREKMINMPFANFVDVRHHAAFRSYLESMAQTGQLSSTEIEMRKGDGVTFYAQLQSVVLYDKSRTSYRVSVADITDRKRVERALSESEQKYRDLVELFPEPVFEADVRGKVTYANQNALASFQFSLEDMRTGINVFDLIAPQDKAIAGERFAQVLAQGDIGSHQYSLLRRNGDSFPALVHTARIMQGGEVVGARGILIDISEQKKAERALAESEKRFHGALDNMLEACVILDFDYRYLYANDSAVRMGRRTLEERLGRTLMEVFPGIEKQETFAHVKRCMEERVRDSFETEFTFPEGIKAWLDMRITPVPEGLLIVYYDVTERKHFEERLQR